jgi:hypothetical protein
MAKKYGKNGEAVAAFLEEVSATDLNGWRAFLELESNSAEFGAASDAVYQAPLSASARSAVYSACLKIVRGLGLANIGPRMGASIIASRVEVAAMGLAVGDGLTPEQLRVILEPFVVLGFRSVAEPTPAPTDQ